MGHHVLTGLIKHIDSYIKKNGSCNNVELFDFIFSYLHYDIQGIYTAVITHSPFVFKLDFEKQNSGVASVLYMYLYISSIKRPL